MTTQTGMRRRYSGYRDERLQAMIRRLVDLSGHHGMTVYDLRRAIPDSEAHHGWISGALSELHKANKITRLKEKREGCKVYVELDFIDSRPCEAQGVNGMSREEIEKAHEVHEFMQYWMQIDTEGSKFATDRTKAERNQRLFFTALRNVWEPR